MKMAFTLIEMMIVVAIISILSGVAIPQYNKYIKKSELVEAKIYMREILDGEFLYKSKYGINKNKINYNTQNINKELEIAIPKDTKFKYFTVLKCLDTLIISAISDLSSISGTTYYIYGNIGDYTTSKFSGNYYEYDYVNEVETPNEAPVICKTR